jgi:hypothetical protein
MTATLFLLLFSLLFIGRASALFVDYCLLGIEGKNIERGGFTHPTGATRLTWRWLPYIRGMLASCRLLAMLRSRLKAATFELRLMLTGSGSEAGDDAGARSEPEFIPCV